MQAAVPRVPTLNLSPGVDIPVLGFGTGTAWFRNARGESALTEALIDALNAGFRHIGAANTTTKLKNFNNPDYLGFLLRL
jgi:diketogulonate reductase-like aldo/keto reductase